jgi:hypothetical protein
LAVAGPVTVDSSGVLASSSALPVNLGGTGQTSASAAFDALLPTQTNNANKLLGTNGTSASWVSPGIAYQTSAPDNPVTGQLWVDSDETGDSLDPYIIRRKTITATAGQTVFTTDVVFTDGYEQIYYNGVLLVRTTDYTTSGSTNTVTLLQGASAGDTVEIIASTPINLVNTAILGANTFISPQQINSSQNGNNFIIQAPGGGTPNFIIRGDGEQTFRFHNTNTTGTTRTSWKMASRIDPDWSWIWYTDLASNGTNDLVLANKTYNPFLYFAPDSKLGIRTSTPSAVLDVNGNAKYDNQIYAGKNKVINGDLAINQRSFTTTTGGGVFFADRWIASLFSGTVTFTTPTIAYGSFAGQTSNKVVRLTSGSSTNDAGIATRIEDVSTFAGQTITVSYWIRSSATTYNTDLVEAYQSFGTGGSAVVYNYANITGKTYGSSWTRLSFQIDIPSVAGKTIGSGNFLNIRIDPAVGIANGEWVEITHLQVESGNSMTPFVLSGGGSQQAELAACQRYFQIMSGTGSGVIGSKNNGTTTYFIVPLKVNMRAAPSMTSSAVGELALSALNGSTTYPATSFSTNRSSPWSASFGLTQATSDGAAGSAGILLIDSANGWIAFSAEL